MAQGNRLTLEHEGPAMVEDVTTLNGTQNVVEEGEESNNAITKPEEICMKWQKAMKKAYEAQMLLQEVIDSLAGAVHKDKCKGRSQTNSLHCLAANTGNSSSYSSSSSSSNSEMYCHEGPTQRKHHHRRHPHSQGCDHRGAHCYSCCCLSRDPSPHYSRSHSRGHSANRHNAENHHRRIYSKYPIIDGYC